MEMSTALQEGCDQYSASGNHMFTVVEHKQKLFRLKCLDEGCEERLSHLLTNAKRRSDQQWYQRWISQRGKLDEPDAILERLLDLCCHLERETRLANSTNANEAYKTACGNQMFEFSHIIFPSHKIGQVERKRDRLELVLLIQSF